MVWSSEADGRWDLVEMLQAQGIMPLRKPQSRKRRSRPGPEDAGPSKRPRTDDAGAKASSSKDEENREDASGRSVKRELSPIVIDLSAEPAVIDLTLDTDDPRRVKRERSPIVIIASGNGEVIDLTLDD